MTADETEQPRVIRWGSGIARSMGNNVMAHTGWSSDTDDRVEGIIATAGTPAWADRLAWALNVVNGHDGVLHAADRHTVPAAAPLPEVTATAREMLERAVAVAMHTPDQWGPHIWSALAGVATAVNRDEREAELHDLGKRYRAIDPEQFAREYVTEQHAGPLATDEPDDVDTRPCPSARCRHPVAEHYGADAARLVSPNAVGCSVRGCRCRLSAERVVEYLQTDPAAAAPVVTTMNSRAAMWTLDEPGHAPAWVRNLLDTFLQPETLLDFGGAYVPPWVVDRLEQAHLDGPPAWLLAVIDAAALHVTITPELQMPAWVSDRIIATNMEPDGPLS